LIFAPRWCARYSPPATINRLLPPNRGMRQRKVFIEKFLDSVWLPLQRRSKSKGGCRE
jgi:hypothetical protein